MWHLYKILDCMDHPTTQMEIVIQSKMNGYTAKKYLNKLRESGFVRMVLKDSDHYKRFNAKAKLWKITVKGEHFKSVIEEYVSHGFKLK